MATWFEHKNLREEGYRSEMGAKKCFGQFRALSGNNSDTATAIIDNSLTNNFTWFYALPSNSQPNGRPYGRQCGQRIGQICDLCGHNGNNR